MKYILFVMILFLSTSSFADRYVVGGASCYVPTESSQGSNAKSLSCGRYLQSTNYTCGPAAVMNLMYYYKMLSSKDMNRNTEMRIAKEMGASNEGTTPCQVESWLSDHGFSVDSGTMVSSQMLIDNINKGVPTIMIYDHHWMVARGYNNPDSPNNSDIIFSDSCSGNTIISRSSIDSMWAEAQMSYNHCKSNIGYYIVAVPSR